MSQLDTILHQIRPLDTALRYHVHTRLDSLTKPRGSLGRLEELALQCALITGQARPRVDHKVLFICCGDHGVCEEGISAYPREVTAQMVYNFLRGGAAISVLARQLGITVKVVDLGVAHEFPAGLPGLLSHKIAYGTNNFIYAPAMTEAQTRQAIDVGISLATAAVREGAQLLGVGEMGIGNTTAATAMLSALSGITPDILTGLGTGLDETRRQHKVTVIQNALSYHRLCSSPPLHILATVGGYEIAGIVGICLAGAALHVPVVIDGFIATAGAWVACALNPAVKERLIFAHQSAEQGHPYILAALQVQPLLDLQLRLGEGTGAALGMGVIDAAVRLLDEMATFAEAGVASKN